MNHLKIVLACAFGVMTASANPIEMQWVSPGDNPVGYYYVSPYYAENTSTDQILTLYCIDFNHEVAPPLEWQANIQVLSQANAGSYQYGNATIGTAANDIPSNNGASIWQDYEAAAWLITQMTQTTNLNQQAIDEYAAWEIFLYPSNAADWQASVNTQGATFASNVAAQYNAAFQAVQHGYTPTGWEIVTPNPAGQSNSTQEFLTPLPTPEPGSIILLGTILVAVGVITRMRMRRRRAE